MDARSICFFSLHVLLRSVTCYFFHEPVILQPDGERNGSDFGFSMGYWRGSLIVGSPSSNFFGEVYSCPLSSVGEKCATVDLNATSSKHIRTLNPEQKFYLGATIATTKDYFFTCAPLATKAIRRSGSKLHEDSYGSCFIHTKNDTSYQVKGIDDRFLATTDPTLALLEGGFGWSTLADEVNGFIIAAKTVVDGDIDYYSTSMGQYTMPNSLVYKNKINARHLYEKLNVGYGLGAGKFFSQETVYAFSMQSLMMTGEIVFMQRQKRKKTMLTLMNKNKRPYNITSRAVNAMFGYTLAAADLNLDGLSELLVGSPTLSDSEDHVEYGALHIYLGGPIESCDDKSRMRTILGMKERGRFGTSVAANDIDGDNLPEIFVSAPYEDEEGVVYILSGYDLKKTLLMSTSNKQVSLRDMTILQKIKRAGMSQLGFSLQVVPDVDRNECDELAIGAPGAAAVLMFKCLQTINVTVSSQIVGSPILREQDMNSTVRVCVHIGYSSKRANVSGYISVQNIVEGGSGASIANPNFKTDLAKRPVQDCKDIYLYFKTAEMAEYTLKTQLELIGIDETLKSEDFVPSVAALSPYSELSKVLKIVRRCSKDDCKPLFSFKLEWSGNPDGTKPYQVGSSKQESLYIIIRNDGHEGYGACVWVSVRGATVSTVVGKEKDGGYECPVISPLIRYGEHSVNITLSMMDLSNMDTALGVVAKLRENCNSPNYKQEELNSSYSLDMEKDLVYLDGVTKNFEITDIEISDENIASFKDEHEYTIDQLPRREVLPHLIKNTQLFGSQLSIKFMKNNILLFLA